MPCKSLHGFMQTSWSAVNILAGPENGQGNSLSLLTARQRSQMVCLGSASLEALSISAAPAPRSAPAGGVPEFEGGSSCHVTKQHLLKIKVSSGATALTCFASVVISRLWLSATRCQSQACCSAILARLLYRSALSSAAATAVWISMASSSAAEAAACTASQP